MNKLRQLPQYNYLTFSKNDQDIPELSFYFYKDLAMNGEARNGSKPRYHPVINVISEHLETLLQILILTKTKVIPMSKENGFIKLN